jgi:hypothetical protein
VTTSVGFMSSSDRRVHFGLGREDAVKEIEIRWPGGTVQKLTAIHADQVLKVEEPSDVGSAQPSNSSPGRTRFH